MTEKYSEEEKLNEYNEFEFEKGVKFIFRVLDNEPSLRFIDKDGKDLIDLIEFAPAGTTFELHPEDKWEATGDNKKGKYKIFLGKFNNASEAILFFLHEAGHLNDFEISKIAWEAVRKYNKEIRDDRDNAYPKKRLLAMARAKEAEVRAERNAWAFVFKKTRELERSMGIKILDKMEGEGSIAEKAKKFADSFLGTYERAYLDEAYDLRIYTKEELENFFQEVKDAA